MVIGSVGTKDRRVVCLAGVKVGEMVWLLLGLIEGALVEGFTKTFGWPCMPCGRRGGKGDNVT